MMSGCFAAALAFAAIGPASFMAHAQNGGASNPMEGMPSNEAAPATTAQSDVGMDPNLNIDTTEALRRNLLLRKPDVNPREMHTLFYTLWQHSLLQEAKGSLRTRAPTGSEIANSSSSAKPTSIREISLGGIVYVKSHDWTIWLNGTRITPKAIPKEVIDIKVHPYSVDLKWFDAQTNVIYPVRLRTHQRFNLDSRIFLPGTGAEQQKNNG
jgi:hypothetical protein